MILNLSEFRDRDYILDREGNYLRVIGDNHEKNNILSYVKYYPSKFGTKIINSKPHAFNSFAKQSFVILENIKNRVVFSSKAGGILTSTPLKDVKQLFSCKQKTIEIINNKKKYLDHKVGKDLIKFLEIIQPQIALDSIGITGSFLLDCYNEKSDIDLVCYGKKAYDELKKVFYKSEFIIPYQNEYALEIYRRRMTHMRNMEFDLLVKQENRKLQGLTVGSKIHINCQPLRTEENKNIFNTVKMIEVGEIECIVKIKNDTEGIFAPAYYEIEVIDLFNSLFPANNQFKKKIKFFISYFGTYSSSFSKDDKVYLQGKLVKMSSPNEECYGIEVSSWNTNREFQACLLN